MKKYIKLGVNYSVLIQTKPGESLDTGRIRLNFIPVKNQRTSIIQVAIFNSYFAFLSSNSPEKSSH